MRKHYERILHDSESRVQRYLDIQILDENTIWVLIDVETS